MKKRPPKTQKQPEYQPPKPLWHFGWRGWTLLPIVIALGIVYFSGYDLQTPFLTLIDRLFGNPTVIWVVTVGMRFHAFDSVPSQIGFSPSAQFGLIAMCLMLLAMGLHPLRFRWWQYLSVFLLGLALTPLRIQCSITVNRGLGMESAYGGWHTILANLIANSAAMVFTVAIIWIVTRSWRPTLFILITGLLNVWLDVEVAANLNKAPMLLGRGALPIATLLDLVWHPALFGILLWWAIGARRRWKPPWACQTCGYDLRGCPADLCPECGTTRMPLRAPSASSG